MHRLSQTRNHLVLQHSPISLTKKPQLKQVYDKYLHSYETRSQQQVKQTTEHIANLTQKNLQRLQQINDKQISLDKQKFQNVIFICLTGIPPFPNQFEFLSLPGKTYTIFPNGFDMSQDQQYRHNILPQCRFEFCALKIHDIAKSNPTASIVFVYHSFGTYILSTYFFRYGTQRVKGLIEIGPAPIRQYMYITEVTNYTENLSALDIMTGKDQCTGEGLKKFMDRVNKELGLEWGHFPTESHAKCFLSYFKSPESQVLFDLNRRFPNVLKLIMFGEDDTLFEKDLLAQRANFYSKQSIPNQAQLRAKFNIPSHNQPLQNHFLYMLPKGKHSLHLQKKLQPTIAKATKQYLNLILGK